MPNFKDNFWVYFPDPYKTKLKKIAIKTAVSRLITKIVKTIIAKRVISEIKEAKFPSTPEIKECTPSVAV